MCLFRSDGDDDDCPPSCIRKKERERELESAGPGYIRNPRCVLFFFFCSVGRSLTDSWTYICAYMFNKRGEATTGEAKKESNITILTSPTQKNRRGGEQETEEREGAASKRKRWRLNKRERVYSSKRRWSFHNNTICIYIYVKPDKQE